MIKEKNIKKIKMLKPPEEYIGTLWKGLYIQTTYKKSKDSSFRLYNIWGRNEQGELIKLSENICDAIFIQVNNMQQCLELDSYIPHISLLSIPYHKQVYFKIIHSCMSFKVEVIQNVT